jgi:hypothetical protein
VLYGKAHCHDTNATYSVTDLVIFDKCVAINIAKLKAECLVDCFGGTDSQWVIIISKRIGEVTEL